jgi:hypothetical protein
LQKITKLSKHFFHNKNNIRIANQQNGDFFQPKNRKNSRVNEKNADPAGLIKLAI